MRNSIASILIAGALMLGHGALASAADAASAGKSALKRGGDGSRALVLESKRRGMRRARAPRIYLPVGPSYVYYDYPYYYSRGHYPTHIARYVYYNPQGRSTSRRYVKSRGRCARRTGEC